MPCLRGIELSLSTNPSNEPIPEYPHPEGASAQLLGAFSNIPNGQTSQRKTSPVVAVYISSIPGSPFAIDYSINTAPSAPCKYVFFRLYMNGRPIAAWGVDPVVRPNGKIVKSLWAPSALYADQVGLEGRNFVFLPGQEHKSVAEEGGLIEIQVFRAKERRARTPRLEEFRYQENYGIAAPSIGLLEQPQDACFYDWYLLDARDSPFAIFRFHYRSLNNLKQLNLIPATELELLCSTSPKDLRTLVQAQDSELVSDESKDSSSQSSDSDEAVFHECNEEVPASPNDDAEDHHLKSPPKLFPAITSDARLPQPSKMLRDASFESYLQRPLPELPLEKLNRISRRSSAESATSTTPSITPSLLQYVDEDSFDPDSFEVGVAHLVQLPPSESTISIIQAGNGDPADCSISDFETSPESRGDSLHEEEMPFGRYLSTAAKGLERGTALSTSPKQSLFSGDSKCRQPPPINVTSRDYLPGSENTPPGRSEMTNASLFLNHAQHVNIAAIRGSDSQASKGHNKSLFAGLWKKKDSGPPSKLSKAGDGGNMMQRAMGSLI
ncbi:hypothetical protein C7999DRAFT_11116 [Corynascus novoguineensis]|uniref:Uncharacterized protein n=1 Tax=Corynascus novoguineensis TaxID=1126955 RepID=A0AAN7D1P7_9PEZI|nr:hypothetical protein C7999DRAFT_11116 [Corynascus novoguineensis]